MPVGDALLMNSETIQFRHSRGSRRREFNNRRSCANQAVVQPMLAHVGEINGHKRSIRQGSDPCHSAGRNQRGPLMLAWREGSAAHELVWLAHPYQGIGTNAAS
jgi:hypothetical protein